VAPGADLALDWGGGRLWLCPERAASAPDHAALLVADFHLGKAHSFRRLGVPVPGGTSAVNLQRLAPDLSWRLSPFGPGPHRPRARRCCAMA
jgi:hypothetical protein